MRYIAPIIAVSNIPILFARFIAEMDTCTQGAPDGYSAVLLASTIFAFLVWPPVIYVVIKHMKLRGLRFFGLILILTGIGLFATMIDYFVQSTLFSQHLCNAPAFWRSDITRISHGAWPPDQYSFFLTRLFSIPFLLLALSQVLIGGFSFLKLIQNIKPIALGYLLIPFSFLIVLLLDILNFS